MLQEWFEKIGRDVGMERRSANPRGCGDYYEGTGSADGFAWVYRYKDYLTIAQCDLVFAEDVHVKADEDIRFLGLRLDYGRHLPPGKVTAFLETEGISFDATIRRGTHLAYTEVVYRPEFYEGHFREAFAAPLADPAEIIARMGGGHHWSLAVTEPLAEIRGCRKTGHAAELFYAAKAFELMSALIEMEGERLPHSPDDYEAVNRVLRHIEGNFQSEIRQAELVTIANMSATKLKSIFHSFTGCSISDYILDMRMDHASRMLAETGMRIEEIALCSGFATASGFSTSFRKRFGTSPKEYRRRLTGDRAGKEPWFDGFDQER